MYHYLRRRKLIIYFFVALFLWGDVGASSAAMSEVELRSEALRETVTHNSKLLEKLQQLQWYGDLRLRYEIKNRAYDNNNTGDSDSHIDTHRPRYRFRFGAKIHPHKDLDMVFRLSTGGNQGTSGNETMGNTFDQDELDVNLAYVSYDANNAVKGLTLQGGKVKNKFIKSEIVWDSDVNFEGITEILERSYGDTKLKFVLGQYIVEETDKSGGQPADDVWVYCYQTQLQQKTGFGKLKFAAAFYKYEDIQHAAITNQKGAKNGQRNALNGSLLRTDMETLDLMAQYSTKFGGKAFKLFGEYAINTSNDVEKVQTAATNSIADDLDTAWEVGFQYGDKKFKKLGDWKVKAFYRLTQQDAVFYALNDTDFHEGGTNSKGYEVQYKLALKKGVDFNYTFWNTKNERGDLSGGRFDIPGMHHFDLKFKF